MVHRSISPDPLSHQRSPKQDELVEGAARLPESAGRFFGSRPGHDLPERLRQADAQIRFRDTRIADLELLERAARARVTEMAQRLAVAETGLDETAQQLALTEARLDETAQQLALTEARLGETEEQLAASKMHLDAIYASRGWRALEPYRRIRANVARLRPHPR